MRIVASLGGSALLKPGDAPSPANLQHAVDAAARVFAAELMAGHHLIITHGSAAPLRLLGLEALNGPPASFCAVDVRQAQSQGWIGYELEMALRNALPEGAIIVSLITQTLVDVHDHAYRAHLVPVGPVYDKETAEQLAKANCWEIGPASAGWCRLVPQPPPQDIVEINAIKRLANTGVTVICGGGGGVPVRRDEDGNLRGVEAVVDKDAASALLAECVDADFFVMLTDIGGIYVNFGEPDERLIANAGVNALKAHLLDFPESGMRQKAKAAIEFVRRTGRPAAIGRLADLPEILAGRRGTLVSPDGGRLSFHDSELVA
jgi:carbamate kinase